VRIVFDGEVFLCGGYVFGGYWDNFEVILVVLDVEGWLYIGDFGMFDVDGFFMIIGWFKEIIVIVGGKNVVFV